MLNKLSNRLKHLFVRSINSNTPKKYSVIVLDVHETIMGGGGVYPVVKREGLDQFFDKYSDSHIVTFTDGGSNIGRDTDMKEYAAYFEELGITNKIEKRYFGWDMKDGLKDLERVAKDFNVDLNDLALVGDGHRDLKSAERYGVKFVKVPSISQEIEDYTKKPICPETYLEDYKNTPHKFSFADLEL